MHDPLGLKVATSSPSGCGCGTGDGDGERERGEAIDVGSYFEMGDDEGFEGLPSFDSLWKFIGGGGDGDGDGDGKTELMNQPLPPPPIAAYEDDDDKEGNDGKHWDGVGGGGGITENLGCSSMYDGETYDGGCGEECSCGNECGCRHGVGGEDDAEDDLLVDLDL